MQAQDEWQGEISNHAARNISMSNQGHPWPRQTPKVGQYGIGLAVIAPDSGHGRFHLDWV